MQYMDIFRSFQNIYLETLFTLKFLNLLISQIIAQIDLNNSNVLKYK